MTSTPDPAPPGDFQYRDSATERLQEKDEQGFARFHPLQTYAHTLDTGSITAKYKEERDKRLRSDGVAQFKEAEGTLAHFKEDPWAAPLVRAKIEKTVKVLVVGGGFGGLVTAVELKQQDVHDFVLVEKGAGFGGTWYWNQYPGASCDVEAMIYLPFLEETGYVPVDRYSYGPEIRAHCNRIVQKWDLLQHAHLQTEITSISWDGTLLRWHVHTNHNDHFISQFVVLATGTLHKPQLPGVRGIGNFKGHHFHTGRWNYQITGGDSNGNMEKLRTKTVGIIGTGASAIQLVPKLAGDVKKLYIFQRTPSTISVRDNCRTDPSMLATFKPGWQKKLLDDFANILQGDLLDDDVECTALEGLEAFTMRTIHSEAKKAGIMIEERELPELFKAADFRLMEGIRKRIEDTVTDKQTAEKLKPWYAFMCKRPAFNNDYLPTFNEPNVELVDTNGQGVSHLTETGVVANGKEYAVDLLIYSTGFEFEAAFTLFRRTGIKLVGKKGQTYDEKWNECGPSTLFGIHVRDFPNVFNIGPAQAGVTANQTHTINVSGKHIAEVIAKCLREGVEAIEPSEDAVEDWGKQIEEGSSMRTEFHKTCPPGYYNRQGKPEDIPVRWGIYPKGIVKWEELLRNWRLEGSMKGMEKMVLRE
ncbi:hypothetical protein HYALB_00010835 [Hymenoscyphus albidus]|uniref:FAD/NAD(P)-binding domain-containing protein n=1 Tax=Hymenoscyphus albidus TaxID=595503 RepID=A0A9N9LI76_9HELO|nr:hypothetical protein HYALB_00010835 [Hymenoscyphus albidus]